MHVHVVMATYVLVTITMYVFITIETYVYVLLSWQHMAHYHCNIMWLYVLP